MDVKKKDCWKRNVSNQQKDHGDSTETMLSTKLFQTGGKAENKSIQRVHTSTKENLVRIKSP